MPRSTFCAPILIGALFSLHSALHMVEGNAAGTHMSAVTHREASAKTAVPPVHKVPWPKTLRDRFGIHFVFIPAGKFVMGSTEADLRQAIRTYKYELQREWIDDERPQHTVRIRRPFYISKYEITQSQWESVMGHNPSRFKDQQHPVENVSWQEVNNFIPTTPLICER